MTVGDEDADDLSQFGLDPDLLIFMGVDGVKPSVPWLLTNYGTDGAINTEHSQAIAERFDFSLDQVQDLSKRLGYILNPAATVLVAPISSSRAKARAEERITKAVSGIARAADHLIHTEEYLRNISVGTRSDTQEGRRINQIRGEIVTKFGELFELASELEALAKHEDILLLEHTHPQNMRDERRKRVISAIDSFLVETGRPLGFTTDTMTSERSGPLIEFTHAVVEAVTDPPSRLSPNTIVADFRELRNRSALSGM